VDANTCGRTVDEGRTVPRIEEFECASMSRFPLGRSRGYFDIGRQLR
jgi:hypothetical protein